jgi:hypothetical protein
MVSMLVGRRHLHQNHVRLDDSAMEQQRNFAQKDRSEIGSSFSDRRSTIGSGEQRIGSKHVRQFGSVVLGRSFSVNVMNADIGQIVLLSMFSQRRNQSPRCSRRSLNEQHIVCNSQLNKN